MTILASIDLSADRTYPRLVRTARAALALLLAVAIPVRAETTTDPLWYLLSTYVLAPDAKAVSAGGEGPADAKGLAALQADLLILSDGFEGFRDEGQIKETLERLKPRMSPELAPFFKGRASSLDAIYRTLAVTDYTWARRFPEPPCEPGESRRKLLAGRDGLFQTAKGEASPWLAALLGPQEEGNSAEQALDQASARAKLSGAEYERLRVRARKLTLALASDKAVGAARARLYCARAAAFSDLAASAREKDSGPISAVRAVRPRPEESVFVVVSKGERAAATLIRSKRGALLVTDAAIVADTDHPSLFAYSEASTPLELTATVIRRQPELGVAVLSYSESLTMPSLGLAEIIPAKDDLVTALGHTVVSGLWTKTSGLVTRTGEMSFQTDAAISPELSGGPVLNEAGEVAGLLVLRPADTEEGRWPVAIPAPVLSRWLDDPASSFAAAPATETIEDAGTAAVLSRAGPSALTLTEAGLGAWHIPNLPPPPSVPNGVCVGNCVDSDSPSSNAPYNGPNLWVMLRKLKILLKPAPKKEVELPENRSSTKRKTVNPPVQAAPKPPPPPPKPVCELIPISGPSKAGANPFEVSVRFSCDDSKVRLDGHRIKFTFEWDGKKSTQTAIAITGASGLAVLVMQVSNDETKIEKVRSTSELSHDELDHYDPDVGGPEEPAPPAPAPLVGAVHGESLIAAADSISVEKADVGAIAATGAAIGSRQIFILAGRGATLRVTATIVLGPAATGVLVLITAKRVFDIGWAIGSVAEEKISDVQRGLKQYEKENVYELSERKRKCRPATPANIKSVVQNSDMRTMQPSVSAPGVQTYVDMIEQGRMPSPIKTDGDIIVDGNHRYIAGLLCRIEVVRTPGTAPLSVPRYPIRQIKVDELDWRN